MDKNYWAKITAQRLPRRRTLALSGGTALGAAILAACGGEEEERGSARDGSGLLTQMEDTSKQAKRGGVLNWYAAADAQTFDPTFSNFNIGPILQAYDHLVEYKPGQFKIEADEIIPAVAESWEFAPDGLSVTLKLRSGVKWHNKPPVNGRPFDHEDVTAEWNRFAATSTFRDQLVNAVNPDAAIVGITASDSRTITIRLRRPLSYVLDYFAVGQVFPLIPKETDSTFDIRRSVIGTGPFMLDNYAPSVSYTFKRNPEYFRPDLPYIDTVQMPFVSEYAAQIAQFKAGNIHISTGFLRGEDILPLKREAPELNLYPSELVLNSEHTAFGWLPEGRSPWVDERVRQAYSMSWDRDAFIEAVRNVSQFEAEGLPVETRWNSAIYGHYEGYWLDPLGKDFGPNAKYFQHNVAEAKKLLTAAGHPNGLEYVSNFPQGLAYGRDFTKHLQILEAFAAEAGFRTKENPLDYTAEFIPKYRDTRGQHEGVAYKIGNPPSNDAIARFVFEFYPKGGSNFYGFSTTGKNDLAGDPKVDALIEKGVIELDTEKRKSIAHELQRYLAQKMYHVTWPGGSSGFDMAWPAVRNYRTFWFATASRSAFRAVYLWLDESNAPLSR